MACYRSDSVNISVKQYYDPQEPQSRTVNINTVTVGRLDSVDWNGGME